MRKLTQSLLLFYILSTCSVFASQAPEPNYPQQGISRILASTVTETSATILWRTDRPEKGQVCAWTQDNEVICKAEIEPTTSHSVNLTELKSDAVYHFYIRSASTASYLHHFRTVKPIEGKPDFTMAIVADPQIGGRERTMPDDWANSPGVENYQRLIEQINQQRPSFVIFPGDMVEYGCRKNFQIFKKLSEQLKMPYYVAAGNHERLGYGPDNRIAYKQIFGLEKSYYAKELFGRHFIFLEPVKHRGWKPDKAQLDWLAEDLKANKDKDVYLISHYAIANDPYLFDKSRGVMPEVAKLLEAHGRVRAVYNGHKNVISATIQKGVLYVSCPQPSAGACGYLLVRVYPGGLTQTFYNTPGIGHLLTGPAGPVKKIPEPEKVRWDSLYRWGRQEARNYSWRFGEPVTSTAIR